MASGKRKARAITVDDFKKKLAKYTEVADGGEHIWIDEDMVFENKKLEKDLSKIMFSIENTATENGERGFTNDYEMVGFQSIGDFLFLGVVAGVDSEIPLYFIVYIDPNGSLRGYIPEEGNTFNPVSRCAFGGEDMEADEDYAINVIGLPSADEFWINWERYIKFDWDKIRADIASRIEVEQAGMEAH